MAADHVERVELTAAVALRDQLRIEPDIGDALGADLRAQRRGRDLVDFIIAEFGVDSVNHDAIVLGGALDRDIVVLDVLDHEVRIAL